jgi:hypothetical protein
MHALVAILKIFLAHFRPSVWKNAVLSSLCPSDNMQAAYNFNFFDKNLRELVIFFKIAL